MYARAVVQLLLFLPVVGCMGVGSSLAPDEIADDEVWLPNGAACGSGSRSRRYFLSGELNTWWATSPLPLSQMVRFEANQFGWHERQELAAYSWTGAVPTLELPDGARPDDASAR